MYVSWCWTNGIVGQMGLRAELLHVIPFLEIEGSGREDATARLNQLQIPTSQFHSHGTWLRILQNYALLKHWHGLP
jgi:hypothetical protein